MKPVFGDNLVEIRMGRCIRALKGLRLRDAPREGAGGRGGQVLEDYGGVKITDSASPTHCGTAELHVLGVKLLGI